MGVRNEKGKRKTNENMMLVVAKIWLFVFIDRSLQKGLVNVAKGNVRSFRYSDETKEILEGFRGDSMNEKFENLIYYCYRQKEETEKEVLRLRKELLLSKEVLKKFKNLENSYISVRDNLHSMEINIEEIKELNKLG